MWWTTARPPLSKRTTDYFLYSRFLHSPPSPFYDKTASALFLYPADHYGKHGQIFLLCISLNVGFSDCGAYNRFKAGKPLTVVPLIRIFCRFGFRNWIHIRFLGWSGFGSVGRVELDICRTRNLVVRYLGVWKIQGRKIIIYWMVDTVARYSLGFWGFRIWFLVVQYYIV